MRVAVLLSSYNGAQYLGDQITSIIKQTRQPDAFFIRDDCSTDATPSLLKKLNISNFPISIDFGKQNFGPARSFFALARTLEPMFDVIVFCDQDDVWEENKIATIIEAFDRAKDPQNLLVFSQAYLADKDLNPYGLLLNYRPKPSLANALVQNIVTGATMAVGRDLLIRATSLASTDAPIIMHDWWIYLIACVYGDIVFVEKPLLYYRQHSKNTIGVRRWYNVKSLNRMIFSNSLKRLQEQARYLLLNLEKKDKSEEFGQIKQFVDAQDAPSIYSLYKTNMIRRQSKIESWIMLAKFILMR